MSETTNDAYKQRIEHAARYLLLDEELCAVASRRVTVKAALLKVGFSQDDINNNKHRHAVDRAKRRLSQASLPSLVDIASPGAFSAIITDTDATVTVTTAATKKKKRKRHTRRTVPQRTTDECEALKAKKKEEKSYFEAAEEWKTQKLLPKKQRISCGNIVDAINKKNNTNVNESTVRDRVNRGVEALPPCRGRKGIVNGVTVFY